MSRSEIIRAWKDASYRKNLSKAELARLPENPAGAVELTEAEAATVDGKLSVAVCSGCHGCTGIVGTRLSSVINPWSFSGISLR